MSASLSSFILYFFLLSFSMIVLGDQRLKWGCVSTLWGEDLPNSSTLVEVGGLEWVSWLAAKAGSSWNLPVAKWAHVLLQPLCRAIWYTWGPPAFTDRSLGPWTQPEVATSEKSHQFKRNLHACMFKATIIIGSLCITNVISIRLFF